MSETNKFCHHCGGTGQANNPSQDSHGNFEVRSGACSWCAGQGWKKCSYSVFCFTQINLNRIFEGVAKRTEENTALWNAKTLEEREAIAEKYKRGNRGGMIKKVSCI